MLCWHLVHVSTKSWRSRHSCYASYLLYMYLFAYWHIYHNIRWILRRATVQISHQRERENPICWLWDIDHSRLGNVQKLIAEKWFLIFQGIVATFYGPGRQKHSHVSLRQNVVYQKIGPCFTELIKILYTSDMTFLFFFKIKYTWITVANEFQS